MSWSRSVAFAVAVLTAGSGLAHAEPGASRSGPGGREDTNGDGVVTLAEARAAALRRLTRLDRDGDGVLTRADARALRSAPSAAAFESRFSELDRDRDGRLSRWESRLPPRRFLRVDRDHDGRLSRAELSRALQSARRRAGPGDALGALIARRDLDGDGRVTRREIERAADLRFRQRDRDGDGQLTARDVGRPAPPPR